MPLIKDGRLAEDSWVTLDDDSPLPLGADPIVSLERWQAEREALLARNGRLGLALRPDQPASLVAGDADRFAVITLAFLKFSDGRAYSAARLLRERYGFSGELRAVGNVLRDQLAFMARCGFDAFEVAGDGAPEAWSEALAEIGVWYQPTADDRPTAAALRRQESVTANWAY